MINGRINQYRELAVRVAVLDGNQQVHPIDCIVDTGFAGHITLPNSVIRRLGLGPPEPTTVTAANEERLRLNAYRGIVLWENHRREVRILEAEGTPLIGIALLWGSLLTAEITDDGEVTISPLPAETSG